MKEKEKKRKLISLVFIQTVSNSVLAFNLLFSFTEPKGKPHVKA